MTTKVNPLRFYVYAYLRHKDSATGKAGTPYYIGKGCGNRAYRPHGKIAVPKDKRFIIFLETNLSDIGSQAIERRMIHWHGKKINNTGILLNIQDGGDGSIVTESTKQLLREINTGKKQSRETIEKRRIANLGRKMSEIAIQNLSISKLGDKNPMYGKSGDKHHLFGKCGENSPNYGKKRSDSKKAYMKEKSGTRGVVSVRNVYTGETLSVSNKDYRYMSGNLVQHRTKAVFARLQSDRSMVYVSTHDCRWELNELILIPIPPLLQRPTGKKKIIH